MFFRSADVQEETVNHIPGIDVGRARFDHINEGFTYRDLFVLTDVDGAAQRLLLLFQKNERDETLLPCPACRSTEVAGNSYPSLGVKSWECCNPLCPDRSIYNRGKRYSFKGLLSQAAIERSKNLIPKESVRRWQRDVLKWQGADDVLDMLVRHYTMAGDVVITSGWETKDESLLGRTLRAEPFPTECDQADFWTCAAWFHRYVRPSDVELQRIATERALPEGRQWAVITGDAALVLARHKDDQFDFAVTSPPYFNARDYAQWPNLYCYLDDMARINAEVFRTLKPGAVYAYNIFDYFDNERTIVFSDMGRKRIPLSAAMVDLFRRIGFEFLGVAVWDKGEIHGKRGFNAGNFSPFYQSPFNCWEHVLLVRKPDPSRGCEGLVNRVLKIHPVVKMIRGENTLGHSAPYPLELVTALLDGLAVGSRVLDPFGGSGTTARAAIGAGHAALLVERDATYAELSRRLIAEYAAEISRPVPSLF